MSFAARGRCRAASWTRTGIDAARARCTPPRGFRRCHRWPSRSGRCRTPGPARCCDRRRRRCRPRPSPSCAAGSTGALAAARARLLDETAVAVELDHPRIAVAVGDEDVAGRIPAEISRAAEDVGLGRRGRRAGAAAVRPSVASGRARAPSPPGLGVELDDHVRAFVYGPDVVVPVTRTACANSKP